MAGNRAQKFLVSVQLRGTILFFTGLGLTVREALAKGPERPSLYVLFAGMMGMPFVWGDLQIGKKRKPPADPE